MQTWASLVHIWSLLNAMGCFLMLVTLRYFLKVDSFLDMYIMFYTYAHVIEWNKKLKTCLHVQQDKRNSRPAAVFSLLFTLHVPCNLFGELYLTNRCMFLCIRPSLSETPPLTPLYKSLWNAHTMICTLNYRRYMAENRRYGTKHDSIIQSLHLSGIVELLNYDTPSPIIMHRGRGVSY